MGKLFSCVLDNKKRSFLLKIFDEPKPTVLQLDHSEMLKKRFGFKWIFSGSKFGHVSFPLQGCWLVTTDDMTCFSS